MYVLNKSHNDHTTEHPPHA